MEHRIAVDAGDEATVLLIALATVCLIVGVGIGILVGVALSPRTRH